MAPAASACRLAPCRPLAPKAQGVRPAKQGRRPTQTSGSRPRRPARPTVASAEAIPIPIPADTAIYRLRRKGSAECAVFGQDCHAALYTPAGCEVAGELELLRGRVPTDFPSGAYLRNGPNHPFPEQRGEDHYFDSDGMVHAAVFANDGRGHYFNRYVKTSSHVKEREAGKKVFGGVMCRSGYQMLGNIILNALRTGRTFKDTANTGLLFFNNRLLALMEASKPFEMKFSGSKERLETAPQYFDFHGQLEHPMTAHPKVCPGTGELMFFGYVAGSAPHMFYSVYGPNGQRVVTQGIDLGKPVMTHDMAITENYSVLLDLPLVFDPTNILKNRFPFGYDPQHPARIGLLPRYGGRVEWFEVDTCNVFHTVNAYEDEETGEVVVHGGRYRFEKDSYFEFNPAYMHEWRLTPNSQGQKKQERCLDDTPVEYPKINNQYTGLKYKYSYVAEPTSMVGLKGWGAPSDWVTFGNILKYDMAAGKIVDAWRPDDGTVYGEVEFVPRAGSVHKVDAGSSKSPEDDGWLVTFGADLEMGHSFVAILDAANLSRGPVAVLKTPQAVPSGLHGTWVPGDALADVMPAWFSRQ